MNQPLTHATVVKESPVTEVLTLKSLVGVVKETFQAWSDHNALRLGAALAFYTVFAIAPLMLIVLTIASYFFGEDAARHRLFDQLSGLLGQQGGEAIQAVVASSAKSGAGTWATVVAVITILVGATGVFVELQDALNTIWEVRRRPGRGVWVFFKDRFLSFAMVLAIGFLLLVSLVISAGLAAFGGFMNGLIPAHEGVWQSLNFILSLGLISLLFAMIFKFLPDVTIGWRDVWSGAVLAAILFNLGKLGLGFYLGRSSVTSAFGAAGSVVTILVWVYYSSQTLFLGAEFTRVYGKRFGHLFRPTAGAEAIPSGY